ncbi:unnamed protein product, partial [Staurois parvus]
FAASAVNHWVPDGDSLPAPGNFRGFPMGERPICKQSSLAHCLVWLCIAKPYKATHSPHSKTAHSTQLTL